MTFTRGMRLAVGCAAVAAAAAAFAGDPPRTVPLVRHEPAAGDSFRAEMTSKLEQGPPGQTQRDVVQTRVVYVCTLLERAPSGKFRTRLEMEPDVTTVTENGVAQTTTGSAKTVTMEMTADETRVIPSKGMAATTGTDVLAGRATATVGETWTADKKLPLGGVVEVPVHSTYKVTSIEKDEKGRDIVRIELASDGVGTVPTSGVRIRVVGRGHATIDSARADQPLEVTLAYRFVAEGGPGPDAETRSEIRIKTTPLAAKETNK